MSQSQRHRRLRGLIKKLNRERKRQANRIDILCNDLIAAQREFMRRLNNVGFAAHFYKDLLGTTDLRRLLIRAGRLIQEELPGTGVTFFLRQPDSGELHVLEGDRAVGLEDQRPQECFTQELAERICKSNRLCTIDDLADMDFEGDLTRLNNASLATAPLNDLGRSLGFVLVYRAAPQPLSARELERIGLITCGLSRAIRGCGVPLHS